MSTTRCFHIRLPVTTCRVGGTQSISGHPPKTRTYWQNHRECRKVTDIVLGEVTMKGSPTTMNAVLHNTQSLITPLQGKTAQNALKQQELRLEGRVLPNLNDNQRNKERGQSRSREHALFYLSSRHGCVRVCTCVCAGVHPCVCAHARTHT